MSFRAPTMSDKKASTRTIPCKCVNAFQDKRYGKGNRLHNVMVKADGYRCTVCKKETTSKYRSY